MTRFTDKTVLITGAASGFGAASARAFATEGARLVLGDINHKMGEGLDCGFVTLQGDVSDPTYASQLANLATETFGSLDIAINNAGIVHEPAKLADIPADEARRVIDIDLMGVFYAMQAQIPLMEKSGGAIVNLASVAGLGGAPRLGAYAAAKHGVIGLTKTAALEYARKNIRVNAVCPSFAATAMAGDALIDPGAEAQMTRGIPMRRLARVEEIVQAILWTADPANSFMTGEVLRIDGGLAGI